jgi:hypothetical protein
MATKYGYVQRDPQDTQLNWSQIATDTVDMLNAEVKTREDKKAAIDQATADYQTILNNVPQGENTQLNEFALNAAEKLQKQMLMQETLLKSGQLNPKQYTIMRQNLSDGTDQAFSLMQDYNDEYATKMAMMDPSLPVSERASQMQNWMMEQVEGFANFTATELVVNPQTGIMSMAKLIPDPKYKGSGTAPLIPDPDPNNLVTVQQLQNRIKTKYTQYDVIGNADRYIKSLGEEQRIISNLGNKYKAGTFKKIKDIRSRVGGFAGKSDEELQKLATEMEVSVEDLKTLSLFEQSQNTFINGELSSNQNFGASVLLDFVGNTPDGVSYEPTFDPDAAAEDESLILLKSVNGRVEAELTDAQKAVAREAYKAQIDIGLGYEETVEVRQVYKPKTATEYARGDRKEKQASVMTNIGQLYAADTDAEVEAAADFLKSINPDIKEISRTASGIVITYDNGDQDPIDFGTKTQRDWSRSTVNYFLDKENRILNLDEAEKAAGVDLSKTTPSTATFTLETLVPRDVYIDKVRTEDGFVEEELVFEDAVKRVIEKEMPSKGSLFVKDNEEVSAPAISAYLAGTGYSAKEYDGFTDDAIILYKDGEETDIIFNIDPGADEYGRVDEYMNTLIDIKFNSLDDNQKFGLAEKLQETRTSKKGATGAAP